MRKIESISVIMPAYNEEKIIRESITHLAGTLQKIAEDYEIIVIDDSSTDATAKILKDLSSEVKNLAIITNSTNEQLGGSLRKGFSRASKDLVFYTDADMPVDYGEILRAARVMEGGRYDGVFGFRRTREGESLLRVAASAAYNRLIKAIFGIDAKDINFSFKLIQRSVLEKLELKSGGSFIDAEMAVKAAYRGYRIKEIEVDYFSRQAGRSNLFGVRVISRIISEMIKYYREINALKTDAQKTPAI